MPVPFLPSRLANVTTAIPDRGQPTKSTGDVQALVGQPPPNMRNPLFKTAAQDPSALAHFLKLTRARTQVDPKDYVLLEDGRSMYVSDAAKAAKAQRTQYTAEGVQEGRSVVDEVAKTIPNRPMPRGQSRRPANLLAFPTDQQFFGTTRPPNPTRGFTVPRG